ncbi:MAG: phosphoribosylglycinamide formyltransferase [Thermoguttaceae bacterium]|jgi:phosphoribosylglycinamide formyltransferase-1|nr:phosphoribosylglycinamide formyltransferase [Thermoguttaceae bacterium]
MSLPIVVLISGTGRTLNNLIELRNKGELDVDIRLVISSSPTAYGLQFAEQAKIPIEVVQSADYQDRIEFSKKVFTYCNQYLRGQGYVVMAGYLSLLDIPKEYTNRVLNIHPSLIPSFCGKNYYGLRVHEEALRRGVKISGCTVHFANNQYDEGPIIVQKSVPVHEDDTSKSLQARVLKAEFEAYPEALRLLAANRVEVVETPYLNKDGRVIKIARIKPN